MNRVFVAGASGVLGRRLVRLLREHGHEVTGMTRSPEKTGAVRSAGADPVVADALNREAVIEAVGASSPDVIVHQLTALSSLRSFRRLDQEFALTNRLRTEGTDNLVAAAEASAVKRVVAQSFAGWPYARVGARVKTEDDPLDPDPPRNARQTVAALKHLERAVSGVPEGIILRYGNFYGPGTSVGKGPQGSVLQAVSSGKIPVVGEGGGVWSFIHIEDAAMATLLAIDRGRPGVFNIVDDDPAPVAVWLPALAKILGASPPRRVPAWLAKPLIGQVGIAMMTAARGASNAKAKKELGWTLTFPTWREGFRTGLEEA